MKRILFCLLLLSGTFVAQSQSAAFYNSRGRALWNGDKHQESLENYYRAVLMKPDNLSFRMDYAITLTSLGRFSEAQHEFLQCLGKDSTYVPAYMYSGYNFYRTGEYRRALQRYEKGLTFSAKSGRHNHLSIYNGIGDCYAALLKTEGLDSLETSRMFECYEIVVTRAPSNRIIDTEQEFLKKMLPKRPSSFATKWFYSE